MLKQVPAGPGKKQFVGRIVTACSHWSPLPLCELTPEDWQLALAAPAIHLNRRGPTMPVLSDVGFEPPPPSDQGAPQSEDPAVSMLLLGWCSPEHDGCDLHQIKGATSINTDIGGTAVARIRAILTKGIPRSVSSINTEPKIPILRLTKAVY